MNNRAFGVPTPFERTLSTFTGACLRDDEHPIGGEYGCSHHPLAKLNEERGLRPNCSFNPDRPHSFNDFQQFTTPLPISRKVAQLVAELVPLEANFVDAGCGNGALSVGLLELGYRGIGVEADRDALAKSLNDWNLVTPFPLKEPVNYQVENSDWSSSKVKQADFIISNPPFYQGFDFLAAAMKRSNVIFFLLPATPKQACSLDTFCQIRGFAVFPLNSYEFQLPGTRRWHTREIGEVDVTLFCVVRRFGQGFSNKIIVPESERSYQVVDGASVLSEITLPENSLIDWKADLNGDGQPVKEQIARTLIRWSGMGGKLTYPDPIPPTTDRLALMPRSISFGDNRLGYQVLSNGRYVRKNGRLVTKDKHLQSNFIKFHQDRRSPYPVSLGNMEPIRLLGVTRDPGNRNYVAHYGGYILGEMVECVSCRIPEGVTPVFVPVTEDFIHMAKNIPLDLGDGRSQRLLSNAEYRDLYQILDDAIAGTSAEDAMRRSTAFVRALFPTFCRLTSGMNRAGYLSEITWANVGRISSHLYNKLMGYY